MKDIERGKRREFGRKSAVHLAATLDRFEAEWRNGRGPRIEAFVAEIDEANRAELALELVELEVALRIDRGESPTADEYLAKLPRYAQEIGRLFANRVADPKAARIEHKPDRIEHKPGVVDHKPTPSSSSRRNDPNRDRQLLVGLLALQNGFVDCKTLVASINEWNADRSLELVEILLKRGSLTAKRIDLLKELAEENLSIYENDPEKSIAGLSSVFGSTCEIEKLADSEIKRTLDLLMAANPFANPTDDDATPFHVVHIAKYGGRYRIVRPLDRGALGEVFIAHDAELHRQVALKEIQLYHADRPDSRARFLREAEITGGLEHPGVVPVYSLGTNDDGRPYYVMRFIRGESMKIAIDQMHKDVFLEKGLPTGAAPAPFRELLGRLIDVCHALSYAHHRGVIHRDLKPSNIMLGEFGETLVIDWGLAKVVGRDEADDSSEETLRPPAATAEDAASSTGAIMGSYPYMSPEQASGRADVGPAADIYSVGAILYRIITGRAAIESGTREEMLAKARASNFPRPRSLDPKISEDLEAICLKAMARLPENRYASVQAFAEDLDRFLADEPVSARREPITLKIGRSFKRNKELAGAAAALLIFAAIGLAVHDRLIARQRDRADRAAFAALAEKAKADRARGDAEIARGIALRERDQAKKDFMNNHETLNRVIEAIAAGEIASLPGSDRVRYNLSRLFLKNIDNFKNNHAHDDSALTSAAEGYRVIANIHRTTGRIEESKPIYRSAVEIHRSLVAAAPTDVDRRLKLVQALIDFGETYRMNDEPVEAVARYQEALAAIEETPKPDREHPAIRLTEGSAFLGFGSTLMDLGRFDESIEKSRRSVAILAENLKSDFLKSAGSNLYYHVCNWIAMARRNTAIALRVSDDLRGAESEIDESIRIGRYLMKVVADQDDFAYQTALSLLMKGELIASQNDQTDRADVFLNQAIGLLERLVKRSTATTLFQRDLAVAYRIRGESELAKNDWNSASIDCDRSLDLLEKLLKLNDRNLDFRGRYAQTLATRSRIAYRSGKKIESRAKLDEAIAIIRDIVRKNPNRYEDRSILKHLLLEYWIRYEFPNPMKIQR
jgi:serine/threonine protein kinase